MYAVRLSFVCLVFPGLVAVVVKEGVVQPSALAVVSLVAGTEVLKKRKCSLLCCRHLRRRWCLCSW